MQSAAGNVDQPQPFDAQTWTPHVVCPACGSVAVQVTRTMPMQRGDRARVRYHRCATCRALFKSVEVLSI